MTRNEFGAGVRAVSENIALGTAAGVASGVTTAYLLGNHNVQWGVAAEWATAIAAFVAAWVAWVQLQNLIDNVKFSNTLKVLDDYYKAVTYAGVEMTPFEATGKIQALADNSSTLQAYHDAEALHRDGSIKWGDDDTFVSQRAFCTIGLNYFTNIAALLYRHKLDRGLILEKLAFTAKQVERALRIVNDPQWNLEELQKLVKDGESYSGEAFTV